MTRFWLLPLLALLAGICVPTQAGINAQLSLWARSSVIAATISFAVGTTALVVYVILTRQPLPPLATVAGQPWWIWIGGILGAFFVATTIYLAPRLGATTLLAWVLAGQMTAALIFDHFGWLGFPEQAISPGRICGAILVAVGIMLVRVA